MGIFFGAVFVQFLLNIHLANVQKHLPSRFLHLVGIICAAYFIPALARFERNRAGGVVMIGTLLANLGLLFYLMWQVDNNQSQ